MTAPHAYMPAFPSSTVHGGCAICGDVRASSNHDVAPASLGPAPAPSSAEAEPSPEEMATRFYTVDLPMRPRKAFAEGARAERARAAPRLQRLTADLAQARADAHGALTVERLQTRKAIAAAEQLTADLEVAMGEIARLHERAGRAEKQAKELVISRDAAIKIGGGGDYIETVVKRLVSENARLRTGSAEDMRERAAKTVETTPGGSFVMALPTAAVGHMMARDVGMAAAIRALSPAEPARVLPKWYGDPLAYHVPSACPSTERIPMNEINIRVAVDHDPNNAAGPYVASTENAAGMGSTPRRAVENLLPHLPDVGFPGSPDPDGSLVLAL